VHTAAEKTTKPATPVRQAGAQGTFFRKADDASFFGGEHDRGQESFFSPTSIQAKLTVSQPDDPYEREADATAERVMRMEALPAPGERKDEELQRSSLEEKDEKPAVMAMRISRTPLALARMSSRAERETPHNSIQRSAGSLLRPEDSTNIHDPPHSRGSPSVPAIQRDGRGPPAVTTSFESSLSASKGGGSPMPEGTRSGMEARFGADFSGVRIHTGTQAESLSSSIRAHAFAHGSDIYFNSGKWAPGTASGDFLLAHELTHTIQQGASLPRKSIQRKTAQLNLSEPSIQRAASDRPVPSQLTAAVEKAKGEEGKVNAAKAGPDGNREGWERLLEYFKTVMGEDKVVSPGGAAVPGAIAEADIKKKRTIDGPKPRNPRPADGPYMRDAMPSWCGIFVFWALHKGGVPMKMWELGGRNISLDAAYPPGYIPKAGDVAYRDGYSHFAIVEKADATTVTSVNGNTAGEDNLGAQVQTREHPLKSWTAFFDPLLLKDGELRSPDRPVEEKEKSLRELRQEVFGVHRKEDDSDGHETATTDSQLVGTRPKARTDGSQTLQTMSAWHVHSDGSLQRTAEVSAEEGHDKEAQGEDAIHAKLSRKEFSTADDAPTPSTETSIQRSAEEREEDRGPPVGLRTGEEQIQGGWFDTALSYANAAYDYAAEGLAAGKRLLLGEARDFAMAIPGYRALRVVLGEDPITSERVDRNGHTFIEAAFDIMPGGRQLHEKLTELGALDEAAAWIDQQIESITGLVNGVVARIVQFWEGIEIDDLASPVAIFEEAGRIIHDTISSVVDFAVRAASELLETVKRWLLTHIVDFIREQTPAYPLLQVILGQDPVTEERVERNGTNILNALLDLGGEEGAEQRRQMAETGTFARVAGWIDEGIAVFSGAYDEIRMGFAAVWDFVSIDALMNPVETFRQIWNTFAAPVRRVLDFVGRAARAILTFIKEVLMARLSAWARGVRGYHLVTVTIGRDPFTGERVPRTVHNLVRGFMSLMEGGDEQYEQLRESGAIDRVVGRVNAAVARLGMTLEYVLNLFTALWNSFSLSNLADPVAAFGRILDRFGEPIGRLIDFVVTIVRIVVETVLQLMQFPTELIGQIIANAMAAFDRIKRDPVGFLKNLLRAIKQGFIQFFDNILQHLTGGLVGWLMAELRDAGVPQLTNLSLRGIITWVLEVLGISMEAIWQKLAAHPRIGPERVARIRGMIGRLEGIWTFIQDVQERGMAAIWERIQEQLSNLWNTILDSIKNWVMETIIGRVVARLLSMLDPTGIMAVVNSAIAIYSAVQSFVRYIREMLEVVNSFVGGVAEIAGGNIRTAAGFLERSMSRAMPVVIGFLANQVGLSGIGRRVAELIGAGRELVDRALTWLVDRAVSLGGRLLEMGRGAVSAVAGWLGFRQPFTTAAGANHTAYVREHSGRRALIIESDPVDASVFLTQTETAINASTLPDAQKTAKLARITRGRTLLQELSTIMNDAAQRENPTIQPKITEVIAIIREIDPGGGAAAPGAAVYTPGFSSGVIPTSFSARFVHKGGTFMRDGASVTVARNHPAGSEPRRGALPVAFRVLQGLRLNDRWARFHILNADFGGAGVDSNLIPTPKYINNPEYLSTLEEPLKTHYNNGLPVWLNATITYRQNYGGVFPQQFNASAGAMKYEGGQWVEDPERAVPSFNRNIDPPETSTFDMNEVLASTDMASILVNISSMTYGILDILRAGRPSGGYTSVRQMERVIEQDAFGALQREFDEFPASIPQPTTAQRNTADRNKRNLNSANYSF